MNNKKEASKRIIYQNDGSYTVYLRNKDGLAKLRIYEIIPGIELYFNSIHTSSCIFQNSRQGNFIEIYFCEEGRIEKDCRDEYIYLGPDEMYITLSEQVDNKYIFPLNHYHGISILIDISKADNSLMKYYNINIINRLKDLCKDKQYCLMKTNKELIQLLKQLHNINEFIRVDYYKIKTLELLLILSQTQIYNKHLQV